MANPAPRPMAIMRATLAALLAIIPILAGVHCFVNRDRIFPYTNTVVVYGREACGMTNMLRAELAVKGISYTYADIDISAINDELTYKLGPGFKESRIRLPVVHVASQILLGPTVDQVQATLIRASSPPSRDYSTFLNGADPAPRSGGNGVRSP